MTCFAPNKNSFEITPDRRDTARIQTLTYSTGALSEPLPGTRRKKLLGELDPSLRQNTGQRGRRALIRMPCIATV